jgi:hypothetical protein
MGYEEYNILVFKPEGNSAIGKLRPSWEDNIKADFR